MQGTLVEMLAISRMPVRLGLRGPAITCGLCRVAICSLGVAQHID